MVSMIIIRHESLSEIKTNQYKKSNFSSEGIYGVAVDIGTTTVWMACCRLDRPEICAQISRPNAQLSMGKDVMMRLMHCQQGKEDILQQMIVQQISEMVQQIFSNR
jgi:uncharacterized 2Fe-2S/4Fe-4S cluster protein (DUF4445 family)